jgi:hypothetical protein
LGILADLLVGAEAPLHICKEFASLSKDHHFRLLRQLRCYNDLFPAAAGAEDGHWDAARLQLDLDYSRCQSMSATQRAHYLPYFKAQLSIFIEEASRSSRMVQMQHLAWGLQLACQAGIDQLPVTQNMTTAAKAVAAQGREDICRLFSKLGMTIDLHIRAYEPWYVLRADQSPFCTCCLPATSWIHMPICSSLLPYSQGPGQCSRCRSFAGDRQQLLNTSCGCCRAGALGQGLSHAAQL